MEISFRLHEEREIQIFTEARQTMLTAQVEEKQWCKHNDIRCHWASMLGRQYWETWPESTFRIEKGIGCFIPHNYRSKAARSSTFGKKKKKKMEIREFCCSIRIMSCWSLMKNCNFKHEPNAINLCP